MEYWPLAQAVNAQLPPEHQMSERTISLLATDKRRPTPKQAEALAQILRRPVRALFPELS
jgi:transcriptional regulator with XRE-family HTH domain